MRLGFLKGVGFQKSGFLLNVPMVRIIMFCGPYWSPLFLATAKMRNSFVRVGRRFVALRRGCTGGPYMQIDRWLDGYFQARWSLSGYIATTAGHLVFQAIKL